MDYGTGKIEVVPESEKFRRNLFFPDVG